MIEEYIPLEMREDISFVEKLLPENWHPSYDDLSAYEWGVGMGPVRKIIVEKHLEKCEKCNEILEYVYL